MATAHDLFVRPTARPLIGIVPVAPDDEIGHLALLLAALATGTSTLRRVGAGDAVSAVLSALAQLGVVAESIDVRTWRVQGAGLRGLTASPSRFDVGTSLAALHALAGVLVAQTFASELVTATELAGTDVSLLAGALRLRGARIEGRFSLGKVGAAAPPLEISALELPHLLGETEQALAVPDASLKNALLLSGLYADGDTYVSEPIVSHDHGERLLQALDAPLTTVGPIVHLASMGWEARLPSFETDIPGDFFGAALLLGAGLLVPGSRVGARDVGLNRTRTGFLELAQQMGAPLAIEVHANPLGEPVGVATTSFASLRARSMDGEMLERARGEVPMLLALAARAEGESYVGVSRAELGRGPDAWVSTMRAFGVSCEARGDGIVVEGQPRGALRAADVTCGDRDVAALALLLALVADAPSRLRGIDALARRFPRVVGTLRAVGADLHVEARTG